MGYAERASSYQTTEVTRAASSDKRACEGVEPICAHLRLPVLYSVRIPVFWRLSFCALWAHLRCACLGGVCEPFRDNR